MNNSLIIDGFPLETKEADIAPKLRADESRVVRIIEALREVQTLKDWEVLKTEIFDNLVNLLEKELLTEVKREESNGRKLDRLAGELKWAEKYSDLSKLENNYKVQLQNIRIRTKLYGKQE